MSKKIAPTRAQVKTEVQEAYYKLLNEQIPELFDTYFTEMHLAVSFLEVGIDKKKPARLTDELRYIHERLLLPYLQETNEMEQEKQRRVITKRLSEVLEQIK